MAYLKELIIKQINRKNKWSDLHHMMLFIIITFN